MATLDRMPERKLRVISVGPPIEHERDGTLLSALDVSIENDTGQPLDKLLITVRLPGPDPYNVPVSEIPNGRSVHRIEIPAFGKKTHAQVDLTLNGKVVHQSLCEWIPVTGH